MTVDFGDLKTGFNVQQDCRCKGTMCDISKYIIKHFSHLFEDPCGFVIIFYMQNTQNKSFLFLTHVFG